MTYFEKNRRRLAKQYYIRGTEKTVSGTSSVLIEESAGVPIKRIEITGKTVQNGVPTLKVPVSIQGSNDNGMALSLNEMSINLPTSVEINGKTIPLALSKYDKLIVDGIKKEVVYLQGGENVIFNGTENWVLNSFANSQTGKQYYMLYNAFPFSPAKNGVSTHFVNREWLFYNNESFYIDIANNIVFRTDGDMTLDEFKAFLEEQYNLGTPVMVLLERRVAIKYDLTSTALGQALLSLYLSKGENGTLELSSDVGITSIDVSYYSAIEEKTILLTIRYLNSAQEEIRASREHNVRKGSKYLIIAPHIDGYTRVSTEVYGVADEDTTIELLYKEAQ